MSDNGQLQLPKGGINPGKLKLRELVEVEKLVGRKIAGELQSGDLGIDTMQGLLWIELRKHNPAATPEQAGEYDLETLMDAFEPDDEEGEGEPVDPTSRPPSAAPSATSNGAPTSKPTPASTTFGG